MITLTELSFIPVIIFGILLICELNIPKFFQPKKFLFRSYTTNLSIFLFNCIMMTIISSSAFLLYIKPNDSIGLLGLITNDIAKLVLSFVLIDMFLYFLHRLSHTYDVLWIFHKVHHNDSYLNLSTSFRIHFIELVLTNLLKTGFVLVIGIDQIAMFLNEIITTSFVMLHHSNIKIKGEQFLKLLIITPAIHHTHHSMERIEHDSNYGAIFSIWDRLFDTLNDIEPIYVGVKGYSPQTFFSLLKFGVTIPEPDYVPSLYSLEHMIAEAAYYRAEKRGWQHGNDQEDWFKAQQEIGKSINV